MGGVGGNTRTLAWLPQVQVVAAKGRGHRMLEDIRLPNLLSRKRPRRNKQFDFASLLFMDHSSRDFGIRPEHAHKRFQ